MKKIILSATAVLMFSTSAIAADGLRLVCKTQQAISCNQSECYNSGKAAIGRVIDLNKKQIHRCHKDKSCDTFKIRDMVNSKDGGILFMNITFGGGGMLRINTNNLDYTETGLLGSTVAISRGSCKSRRFDRVPS